VLAVCGSGVVVARSLRSPVPMDRSRFSPNREELNRQTPEVECLVTRRKQTMATRSNRQKFQICKTKNLAAAGASSMNLSAFLTGLPAVAGLPRALFAKGSVRTSPFLTGLPRASFAKGSVCVTTFLTGFASQTEFAVTHSKQKTATFLTGSRFARQASPTTSEIQRLARVNLRKRYVIHLLCVRSASRDRAFQRTSTRLAQSVFCEGFGVHKHISTRFWLTSRNRRNSLKTNARRISTRFPNCTSAGCMQALLSGKVDANDVVLHFDHAARVLDGGFLAELLHRGVVGAAVEPAGVVYKQNVAANGMAVDGGEFLLNGRGDVVIVRVEPEKAGLFERGQELGQNFSAVTLKNVNVRALCEFPPRAFGPPAVEIDGINLAKAVLVHVEHVREVHSGFHQNVQIEFAGEFRDGSLLHQVRRAGSRHRAKFPRSIFAASGNTLVKMKEPAIAERLPEFGHDPAA
jgi:hypothetical protein